MSEVPECPICGEKLPIGHCAMHLKVDCQLVSIHARCATKKVTVLALSSPHYFSFWVDADAETIFPRSSESRWAL